MSRIPPVDPRRAGPRTGALLEEVRAHLGATPRLHRTLGHSPAALEAYLAFERALAQGSLSPELRARIALAVSRINASEACLRAYTLLGRRLGLDERSMRESRRGISRGSPEDAAVEFARRTVLEHGWVGEAELGALARAGFGPGEVAEIVAQACLTLFANYFDHVARPDPDPPHGAGDPAGPDSA